MVRPSSAAARHSSRYKSVTMFLRSVSNRLAVAVMAAGFLSCHPGGVEDPSQTDVVLTFHMNGANFAANKTFAMPDSVVDISVAAGHDTSLNHTFDHQVLTDVAQQLQAVGYTRVGVGTKPDMVVLVAGSSTDFNAYAYVPWWPWWGWWPGWGGYWPYGPSSTYYYPWVPVSVNYTSGSIFIFMLDPDVPPPPPTTGQATVIWSATINGLLEGSDASIAQRIDAAIAQAFAQSPYLSAQ